MASIAKSLKKLCAALMLPIQICALSVSLAASCHAWTADNGDGTYKNPLFYADYPDPDIIRVGSDFYMTSTTMFSLPGLPILRSKDLVNWEILGYAAPRLKYAPAYDMVGGTRYARGLWAASLRYHNGLFYILENTLQEGSILYTAKNPAGPWTETKLNSFFYDPSLMFDDDGTPYVFHGTGGKIWAAKLSPDLSKTIWSKPVLNIPNTGAEGSHALKINGEYFVFNAVGGPDSRLMCSRSRNIEGPYETVVVDDDGKGWGGSHQGAIVQLPSGEWWGFAMADHGAVGRVTNLSPITWKDGWPYFGTPEALGKVPARYQKPKVAAASRLMHLPASDDFHGPVLGYQWEWNHNPDDSLWSLAERPGFLRLHSVAAPNLANARNTLTQRTEGPFSSGTVVMDTRGLKPGDTAGLGLFDNRYTSISVVRDGAGLHLVRQINKNGSLTVPSEDVVASLDSIPPGKIWIRICCDFTRDTAELGYSLNGKQFLPLGEPINLHYDLGTFEGERFALFSFNRGGRGGYVDIGHFVVRTSDTASIALNSPVEQPVALNGDR